MGLHLFGYTQMSVFVTHISLFLQYNRQLADMFHVKGQLCAFTFFNTLLIQHLTFQENLRVVSRNYTYFSLYCSHLFVPLYPNSYPNRKDERVSTEVRM